MRRDGSRSAAVKTILFAAGLLCVASASLAQTPAAPATLRLASAPDDDVTPVLYAQHAGLFRAAGIDVVITPLANGAAVAAAVAGGSVDVGKSSTMSLINAHARGVPLTIVAPSGFYDA